MIRALTSPLLPVGRAVHRRLRGVLRLLWRPPKGSLQTYRAEFPDTARAFQRFIARSVPFPEPQAGPPVGIVVSPWVATPVPWYSIAIGMGLARRGRRVTLIHDDTLTAPESPAELLPQHRAICRVTQLLTGHLPTITLTSQAVHALSPADEHEVARLAKLIVIWKTRGALLSASDLAEVESLARSMADTLGRIKALLGSAPFAYLLVGGGIYGSSGLFLWAGQQCGLRVSTFDANLGVVQISTVGLAAQQADIPRAFSEAIRWDSVTKARALQEARHHLDQRVQAKDPAQYQVTASSNASARRIRPPFALVAMNVEHDAAALGRHVTFADTMEWILEVTDFVLEHTSNASVVVRQHPAERKPNEGSQFPIRRVLSERYGSEPRVVFISAAEPVNTYDLVSEAAMVLPYVSTIGIEAAALGKPVLVSGQSCYSDLGFVRTAASRGEYFELLRRGLNADLELLPDQVEKALLCYYLTPVCNRIWTQFTPQPRDFWRWQKASPPNLYADAAVSDILTSLDENTPPALVRHRRLVLAGSAS